MDFIIAQVVYLRWKKVLTIAVCVCVGGGDILPKKITLLYFKKEKKITLLLR
jgi:hypothetical protein